MNTGSASLAATEEDAPFVCPGCYAVGDQACASWCIDAELAREHEEAYQRGDFSREDDDE